MPPYERSGIWKSDQHIGYEEGVSVYDCLEKDGKYEIVLPTPLTASSLYTIQGFILYNKRRVYLVSGNEIGQGTDKEPIIKNIRIIKEITKQIYGLE